MTTKHNLLALAACFALVIGCSDDQDKGGNAVEEVTPTPGTDKPDPDKPDPDKPDPDKPDPVVQDPVKVAIQFNSERLLPIRFILKLKQSLGVSIDRTTIATAVAFDEATIKAVGELQAEWFGTSRDGRIDAETLMKIEDELFHEDGMHALIGLYTQPDDILVSGLKEDSDEVDESVYLRCQEIIEQYGGYFDTTPGRRNMLALRGAMLDGDKLRRTQTAKLYIDNIHANNPLESTTVHFASGSALHPASGQSPFDDMMLTIWKEEQNGTLHYHVQALPLNVDPGMQG
ncbi:MAG: hypothetical protein J6A01_05225, partial [Proteobacteria bacterium]|nr:hypothetical protein [Pseudomonadota bacterium]